MSKTARCAECNRTITLSLKAYAFRRHMRSRGVICPGSWEAPDVVSARVAERPPAAPKRKGRRAYDIERAPELAHLEATHATPTNPS